MIHGQLLYLTFSGCFYLRRPWAYVSPKDAGRDKTTPDRQDRG